MKENTKNGRRLNSLSDCAAVNPAAKNLYRRAKALERWGIVLLFLFVIVMVSLAFVNVWLVIKTGAITGTGEVAATVPATLLSYASTTIFGGIGFYITLKIIVALLRAHAENVQSRYILANVALFRAASELGTAAAAPIQQSVPSEQPSYENISSGNSGDLSE